MTQEQPDKKAAKKPKKAHVPNPSSLPASLVPKLPNALRQKKR